MKRRTFLQTFAYGSFGAEISSLFPLNTFGKKTLEFNLVSELPKFGDERDWFFEKKFGLFIHWGLYSIPGWHEQHQLRANVSRNEYIKLVAQWNPTKFDPNKWLDLLEESGMKYLCITAKHCDGFCLWDTKQTAYNTMNTPYKHDIIGMLADTCHKRNIPLCLYYSIVDWNNPNYPNQGRSHELQPQPQDSPNQEKYLEFLKMQVKELCSNYGDIHGFWWDANRLGYKDLSINAMIRELQPKAVINNRGFDDGDFSTPERDYEKDDKLSFDHPVEACQSVGMESWGYRKDENYYTNRYLIRSIDRYLSRGANYLLNVGPDASGKIPAESSTILKSIGQWYHSVKEAFDKTEPASYLTTNQNIMLTKHDNTLYVHLNKDPEGNAVKLRPFTIAPKSAVLLNNGDKVDLVVNLAPQDYMQQKPYLRLINLPTKKMSDTVLVVKLEFDRPPEELVLHLNREEIFKEGQK